MNPNQPILDAIRAATRIENDYGGQSTQAIIIDVQKFVEVFNNHRDRKLCTALSTPVLTDSVLKSAPAAHASHNSGEGDPSVMPDCVGADTDMDARTGTADDQGLFALLDGEAVAWQVREITRLGVTEWCGIPQDVYKSLQIAVENGAKQYELRPLYASPPHASVVKIVPGGPPCPTCGFGMVQLGQSPFVADDEPLPASAGVREALIAARDWIVSNTTGENDPGDGTMYERGWWSSDTELMEQIDRALASEEKSK